MISFLYTRIPKGRNIWFNTFEDLTCESIEIKLREEYGPRGHLKSLHNLKL
jgi:hypothetical protein